MIIDFSVIMACKNTEAILLRHQNLLRKWLSQEKMESHSTISAIVVVLFEADLVQTKFVGRW